MRQSPGSFRGPPSRPWNESLCFDKRTSTGSTLREMTGFQCSFNSLEILSRIFKSEGVAGLFRGNYVNCLRVAPCSAVEFYSFEVFKDLVSKRLTNTREEVR